MVTIIIDIKKLKNHVQHVRTNQVHVSVIVKKAVSGFNGTAFGCDVKWSRAEHCLGIIFPLDVHTASPYTNLKMTHVIKRTVSETRGYKLDIEINGDYFTTEYSGNLK